MIGKRYTHCIVAGFTITINVQRINYIKFIGVGVISIPTVIINQVVDVVIRNVDRSHITIVPETDIDLFQVTVKTGINDIKLISDKIVEGRHTPRQTMANYSDSQRFVIGIGGHVIEYRPTVLNRNWIGYRRHFIVTHQKRFSLRRFPFIKIIEISRIPFLSIEDCRNPDCTIVQITGFFTGGPFQRWATGGLKVRITKTAIVGYNLPERSNCMGFKLRQGARHCFVQVRP